MPLTSLVYTASATTPPEKSLQLPLSVKYFCWLCSLSQALKKLHKDEPKSKKQQKGEEKVLKVKLTFWMFLGFEEPGIACCWYSLDYPIGKSTNEEVKKKKSRIL